MKCRLILHFRRWTAPSYPYFVSLASGGRSTFVVVRFHWGLDTFFQRKSLSVPRLFRENDDNRNLFQKGIFPLILDRKHHPSQWRPNRGIEIRQDWRGQKRSLFAPLFTAFDYSLSLSSIFLSDGGWRKRRAIVMMKKCMKHFPRICSLIFGVMPRFK